MDYQTLPFNFNTGAKSFDGRSIFGTTPQANQVNSLWANNQIQPTIFGNGSATPLAGTVPPAGGGSIFDSFLTKGDQQGWGGMALGVGQGLANAYMGMKQYGLAKDTFNQNKLQFEKNFANQTKLTNSRLKDRQTARVASNPGAYQSVGEYMKQNGV